MKAESLKLRLSMDSEVAFPQKIKNKFERSRERENEVEVKIYLTNTCSATWVRMH